VIGQSISNIYLQGVFLGVSHFGAPHRKINVSEQRSLWELMLAMNQNETTARDFRENIADFLAQEYRELQISTPEEPVPYSNWEFTYCFVRTRPPLYMSQEDMFQNQEDWIGTILIQTVDKDISKRIAERGIGTVLFPVPALAILLDEYWDWQVIETAVAPRDNDTTKKGTDNPESN
jgi:hypothetical protein